MRVIPVIDLQDGTAVHAVRGARQRYLPVRSRIVDGSDPVALARAFREELGLDELYVADLGAIGGRPPQREMLAALASEARMMVDAGVTTAAQARALLELGAARVIAGTETLPGPGRLAELHAELPGAPLVLSLDLRDGLVVSPDPELAGLRAPAALAPLARAGAREMIVLDLARVGTAAGPDVALVRELAGRAPGVELLAGGGVRDAADLRALRAAGAAAALVATALHRGAITRDDVMALG